jgi:hypothetical protein
MGRSACRVIMISDRDSSRVSTCLLLTWVAPYSGRPVNFQFGDEDHSNGGGYPCARFTQTFVSTSLYLTIFWTGMTMNTEYTFYNSLKEVFKSIFLKCRVYRNHSTKAPLVCPKQTGDIVKSVLYDQKLNVTRSPSQPHLEFRSDFKS